MKKLLFELRIRKISFVRSMIICVLFLIVGISAISLMASFADPNLSGANDSSVTSEVVFVNDLASDYWYYKGLNYTTITGNSLPTYSNKYGDNLVRTFVTYSGTDINNSSIKGKVSPLDSEGQSEYRYYKYYPKDEDGYITIELIDNPFSSRPYDTTEGKYYGFNGWVTSNQDTTIYLDKTTYTRYAKVYVGNKTDISLTFNASWYDADYRTGTYTEINNFSSYGMKRLPTKELRGNLYHHSEDHYYLKSDEDYYEQTRVTRNTYFEGYVFVNDNQGTGYEWYAGNCGERNCSFFRKTNIEWGMAGITLYRLTPTQIPDRYDMVTIPYTPANFDHVETVKIYQDQFLGNILDMPNNYNAVGMFYKMSSMGGGNPILFYDETGKNCALGGSCDATVYKLIHVTDPDSIRKLVTETELPATIETDEVTSILARYSNVENYYYLVTRDMNILRVNNNETLDDDYMSSKPYTLTGSAYGETINRSINASNGVTDVDGDMVIENININNNMAAQVSTEVVQVDEQGSWWNTYYSEISSVLSANRHNFKIGRNVKPSTAGNFSFYGIVGTSHSSNTHSEFKVIIESGVYDYFLSNGFNYSINDYNGRANITQMNNTMHGIFTYGSDYDRVSASDVRNTRLTITYCAYASHAGGLSGKNTYTPSSTMIIKSGSYGKGADGTTYDTDYSHGLYVGSRGTGGTSDSSLREMIVEGGDINVINGGPLVNSNNYDKNVVALYMKGGKVRSIFGGAGQSATGGNRIISVTSGEVTNNVFGGSNSYTGSGEDGYLDGDTLVYIGGNSVIGTSNTILFNVTGQTAPEVGDVFGAGNGKSTNDPNIGTVNNSHVIIDGGVINGSVYGGGNFGSVGLKVDTSETKIDLLGGTIDGSVYGAGNNAGGGSAYSDLLTADYYTGINTITPRSSQRSGWTPAGVFQNPLVCQNGYPGSTGNNNNRQCTYAANKVLAGSLYNPNTRYYRATGTQFVEVTNPSHQTDSSGTPITININLNGSKVGESIYGGSNTSGTVNGTTKLNLVSNTDSTPNVYGGGKGANTYVNGDTIVESHQTDNSKLTINEAYGGSALGHVNGDGSSFKSTVTIDGGTFTQVYGGGEGDATHAPETAGDITVNIESGSITEVYGANNKNGTPSSSINVHLKGGTITDAYGGGNSARVDSTTIYLEGSTVTDSVYGGSNKLGENTETIVHINSGTAANVFGGNNVGGSVDNTYVYYDGATVTEAVYGCGEGQNTSCDTTNVVVNGATGNEIYGGGLAASVDVTTNVMMVSGSATALYGGSNTNGTVKNTNVYLSGGTTTNAFGGNNEGGTVNGTHVNVGGGTNTNVYGGGNSVSTDKTEVNVYGGLTGSIYGGGLSAGVGATGTKITVNGGTVNEVYGGSNSDGTVPKTDISIKALGSTEAYDPNASYTANNVSYTTEADGTVTYPTYSAQMMRVNNVYGGNNAGGVSNVTDVKIEGGTTNNVYGGSKGTGASAGTPSVTITGGTTGNVYGGGDNAVVTGDTSVIINGGTVTNLFGGGNGAPATVNGSTYVIVNGGLAQNNVYGGGNNAVTKQNTTVSIIDGEVQGSLFGAGNNAPTGTENNNNSVSTVNVLSGKVDKNIYGGANFSQVFGSTDINIGDQTVSDERLANYTYDKEIYIGGTIFGGGEAKSENDDEYDWTYISVTQGLEIVIDGTGYDMQIDGSVFGSGNASSSAGVSNVIIKNFGTDSDVKTIESIQRATNVKIINSSVQIKGAIDSTNKYSNEFALNRIDNFYLLDNSSIYLLSGANVLKNFNSGYIDQNDEFQKETVSIDNGGVISDKVGGDITLPNVNNRLYMAPNKHLNVLTEEDVIPAYAGMVNGMCFLGIYVPNDDGKTMNTGIYNTDFENGQSVDSDTANLLKIAGTYVYGKHKDNHDITKDGYWSYYLNTEGNAVNINYVDVTPKTTANYYMWAIGVQLHTFEIELYASRYSTVGVKNLSLIGYEQPNTQITVNQFQYENLNEGVVIVDKSSVKKVADTGTIANSRFGLEMSTSDTGWMSSETTQFFSNNHSVDGSKNYETESTSMTPTLSFYLYNSKNIELDENEERRSLGYGSVIMTAVSPDPDDPTGSVISYIEVKVKIYLQAYVEDGYSSVIAPGKKYSVFPYVAANISSKGSVSIYHNLFLDLTGNDKNGEPWSAQKLYPTGAYRALVSDYVYPVGTTVTMFDLTDNQYYYYTVTPENIVAKQQEKLQNGEVSYYLRDFLKMDSISPGNHYDDASSNARYLNTQQQNAFEEFIFTVDFADANVNENVTSRLYLELRDPNQNDAPIMAPLPFQGDRMKFKLFTDAGTQLITTGTLSSDTLYVGDNVTVDLNVEYRQATVEEQDIYDTAYDEYQLGSAITFYDEQGNKLDGSSLLGVVITVNNRKYYAQTDGTFRVKLAGKVANVSAPMVIETANSNITSGQYTMKIETFGSYDGLYTGEIKNEPLILSLNILNNKFGLLVESDDVAITHDKYDATDANGNKKIDFLITTSSGQDNPNLRVRVERREYGNASTPVDLDYQYEDVDLGDLFIDQLEVADADKKLYYVTHDLPETINFSLTLRDDITLRTGTYRIVFGVYDGDNYIGSVYRYLIIREMK